MLLMTFVKYSSNTFSCKALSSITKKRNENMVYTCHLFSARLDRASGTFTKNSGRVKSHDF